jgi:hypothetical protein
MRLMATTRPGKSRDDRPLRRGPPRLAFEIAVVLVVKTLALVAIWQLWFSPSHRHEIDLRQIAASLDEPERAPARGR